MKDNTGDSDAFDLQSTVTRLTEQLSQAYQDQKELAAENKRMFERERRTRKFLLRIHGIKAFLVGVAVIMFGAPLAFEISIGSWTRPVMGWLAVFAGLSLWAGQNLRHRNFLYEILGVFLVGLWDTLVVASFLIAYYTGDYQWHILFPYWIGNNSQPAINQIAVYPIFVYSGLAMMLWFVHMPAVIRDYRCGSRHASNG